MIEAIFAKGSQRKKPVILEECILFIGLSWHEIGTTYVFQEHLENKAYKIGGFTKRSLVTEHMYYGYFSSLPYSDLSIHKLHESEREEVAIIGYSNERKYYVYGISVDKYEKIRGENYIVFKFSFFELKLLRN
ncbi:hypothetical protein P4T04_17280 [Bacillus badius]|uniref:hypothetical protein n=1 Tax=Bacillus badius TaxID=1455 RepID=UPI002E1C34B6|nr:hypothetical protein [Bacillus badius]